MGGIAGQFPSVSGSPKFSEIPTRLAVERTIMGQTTATKITYATLSGEGLDEVHRALDAAIERAPESFGGEHPMIIGEDRVVAGEPFEDRSPVDDRIVLGQFQSGSAGHVQGAVAAARRVLPEWSLLPWQERVGRMRSVAEAIRAHRWELSVILRRGPATELDLVRCHPHAHWTLRTRCRRSRALRSSRPVRRSDCLPALQRRDLWWL